MRIRTIKPEFFLHEGLYDLEAETGLPVRLAFIGLWCAADREGRFRWAERRLKASIMPYDTTDFSRVLHALGTRGFIVKYRVGDECFGVIPSFKRHQIVNFKERASDLPQMTQPEPFDASPTRDSREEHACHREGKGTGREQEGKGKEGKGSAEGEVSSLGAAGHLVGGASPTSKGPKVPRTPKLTDAEWLLQLSADPTYDGIDVHREHGKMLRWCQLNQKHPTRRRFLNWLNRADKPMAGIASHEQHPNDRNLGGGDLWDATAPGGEDDVPFNGNEPTDPEPESPGLAPG